MSNSVRRLIELFETLPESDKREALTEILLRSPDESDLPTPMLDALAEELFASLDAEETSSADR